MSQRPGSDTALLNGMLHVIFAEGLENKEFIAARTENIEEARKAVEKYTPEFVERLTGVPRDQVIGEIKTPTQVLIPVLPVLRQSTQRGQMANP